MMKKTLLTLACVATILLAPTQYAAARGGIQMIQFGVKAGASTNNMDMVRKDINSGDLLRSSKEYGYHFGLMSRINLLGLYIQPELLYNVNKYEMNLSSLQQGVNSKVTVQNVEVPILVGFKLLFLRAYAGPVFTVLSETGTKISRGSANVAVNANLQKPTVSYQIGAGVDIGKFNVDVRYAGGFKKSTQTIQVSNVPAFDTKTRLNQWMLSVGWFF